MKKRISRDFIQERQARAARAWASYDDERITKIGRPCDVARMAYAWEGRVRKREAEWWEFENFKCNEHVRDYIRFQSEQEHLARRHLDYAIDPRKGSQPLDSPP